MPLGIVTALLAAGAVLTSVNADAGSIVAGLGVLVEAYYFGRVGLDAS